MSKKNVRKNRAPAPQQARQSPASVTPPPGRGVAGWNGSRQGPGPQNARPDENSAGGDAVKSRILWLLSAVLIVSGYALLHKVDPGGQNGWAILSPALLLCGYLLIIPAISYTYRR